MMVNVIRYKYAIPEMGGGSCVDKLVIFITALMLRLVTFPCHTCVDPTRWEGGHEIRVRSSKMKMDAAIGRSMTGKEDDRLNHQI